MKRLNKPRKNEIGQKKIDDECREYDKQSGADERLANALPELS